MGFITRNTKSFKNVNTVRYLYLCLIKSILMYGSTIWRPTLKNGIIRLEKVQHRVLRRLASLSGNPMSRYDHNYDSAAESFSLASIHTSMIASDNIFTYRIMSGQVRCNELRQLLPLNNPGYTLRNSLQFYPEIPSSRHSEGNPIYRLCRCFNEFSLKLDSFPGFNIEEIRMNTLIKKNTLTYN